MVDLIEYERGAQVAVSPRGLSRFRSMPVSKIISALFRDPRHFQITALSTLVLLGAFYYAFGLPLWHVLSCVGSTVATQFVGDKITGRRFDARSPLISALSITLLLRTGSIWLSLAAGIIAIGSKYVVRWRGKHIFNPANVALVILALAFDSAWVSPGQWGAAPWLAIALFGVGGAVTKKASRWDVSLAFLASYAALVLARALWLGDPLSIPVHQLQSGALLVFAFFMISDPKTTPNARLARVIYAALVAIVGFTIQFALFKSAGVIFALVLTAPLVPFFDNLFPASRYYWPNQIRKPVSQSPVAQPEGVSHDTVQT
ncbi:RnfABCDGE type electron transport complex subunit D [Robiginitomaculum antarcticum]|uniref:RnfABCDGE type electron transport complex subunit D n=1 Tax=Robiginitomaculum antarcticum TaxID=437507 RepID=UPI0003795E61|nr:RnfABCDGE type electron transport complex subunit D [Robiginitomaculum antarcticum]